MCDVGGARQIVAYILGRPYSEAHLDFTFPSLSGNNLFENLNPWALSRSAISLFVSLSCQTRSLRPHRISSSAKRLRFVRNATSFGVVRLFSHFAGAKCMILRIWRVLGQQGMDSQLTCSTFQKSSVIIGLNSFDWRELGCI
jgi:hypothetical protein